MLPHAMDSIGGGNFGDQAHSGVVVGWLGSPRCEGGAPEPPGPEGERGDEPPPEHELREYRGCQGLEDGERRRPRLRDDKRRIPGGRRFRGLTTGPMLREIWDESLLFLWYCILPWTCSIWPRTPVSSRSIESASCTSRALLYRSRSDCSAASRFRSRDCRSTYSSVTSCPETVSVVTSSPSPPAPRAPPRIGWRGRTGSGPRTRRCRRGRSAS